MDEIPCFMDMIRGATLEFKGAKTVEAKFTNSKLMRFTVNAAVTGTGVKLPVSTIWRWTPKKKATPSWAKKNVQPCLCSFTKGGSQSADSMIEWIQDILLPYLDAEGRRPDEWALLILDPATAHRAEEVRDLLKELRIAVAMMPSSTTWRFQMIDVVVGKAFKDALCDKWADWMLQGCDARGVTPAGNFRHPSPSDCNQWVTEAWHELRMDGVLKKAEELGMDAAPGPAVEGYVEEGFEDVQPLGQEEEYFDEALWNDLVAEEEQKL